MDIAKEIGEKLKRYREATGLSQQDIADRLLLTKVAYGNMERGTSLASIEHLVRLPAILGVRITDLLPDSVVTEYDRARAADPRLQEINEAWKDLPEFLQDGITDMARRGKKEFGRKKA